jgi:hypothetical protein
VSVSTRRGRRQLPQNEKSEAQLDDDDDDVDEANAEDLPSSTKDRLSELAEYRKITALQCSSTLQQNAQLGMWVGHKAKEYRLHRRRKAIIGYDPYRIQELENLGFEWNSLDAD